jgi:hypothetical protein
MATLSEAAKRFIVQALACYDSPSEVAEAVKEEFGLEVHRSHVAQYDPSKASGKALAKKWRELFQETRDRFREETDKIPIAARGYRLRRLEKLAAKAESMRNLPLALQIYEQAAKESGDAYVNHKSNGGGGSGDVAQALHELIEKLPS